MGTGTAIRARVDSQHAAAGDRPARAHHGEALSRGPLEQQVTLLELVEAVGDVTDDETEVVATVVHMLRSGTVKLRGSFRGLPPIHWATRSG